MIPRILGTVRPMMKNELTDWTQQGNTVSAQGATRSEFRSL